MTTYIWSSAGKYYIMSMRTLYYRHESIMLPPPHWLLRKRTSLLSAWFIEGRTHHMLSAYAKLICDRCG